MNIKGNSKVKKAEICQKAEHSHPCKQYQHVCMKKNFQNVSCTRKKVMSISGMIWLLVGLVRSL